MCQFEFSFVKISKVELSTTKFKDSYLWRTQSSSLHTTQVLSCKVEDWSQVEDK